MSLKKNEQSIVTSEEALQEAYALVLLLKEMALSKPTDPKLHSMLKKANVLFEEINRIEDSSFLEYAAELGAIIIPDSEK